MTFNIPKMFINRWGRSSFHHYNQWLLTVIRSMVSNRLLEGPNLAWHTINTLTDRQCYYRSRIANHDKIMLPWHPNTRNIEILHAYDRVSKCYQHVELQGTTRHPREETSRRFDILPIMSQGGNERYWHVKDYRKRVKKEGEPPKLLWVKFVHFLSLNPSA